MAKLESIVNSFMKYFVDLSQYSHTYKPIKYILSKLARRNWFWKKIVIFTVTKLAIFSKGHSNLRYLDTIIPTSKNYIFS